MAVIDMKKVTLIGIQSDKEKILKIIQSMGNLEISSLEEQEGTEEQDAVLELRRDQDLSALEEVQAQLSQVEFGLELMDQYNPVKSGLFDMKPQVDAHELAQAFESRSAILAVVSELRKLEESLSEISLKETRLNNTILQMEPWEKLDIPLNQLEDTLTTRVLAGTVNNSAVQRFLDTIDNLDNNLIVVQQLGQTTDETCFFVAYHNSIEEEVSQIFKEFAFSQSSFSGYEGTPGKIIAEAKEQLNEARKARDEIIKTITELSNTRHELQLLYDALLVEVDRLNAIHNLIQTDHTFVLRGWLPAKDAEKFSQTLRDKVKDIYIKLEDPAPDEDFPVALENHPIVTPFEMVTELYSTPNPRELDPNAVMAPFYAIFFGIMMGDAGYGIVMALAAYLFIRKLKPKGNTRKLAGVIFIGGIFTFIWGAVFGGWFGDAGTRFGINPIWFNPSEEPIKMLAFCFACGVIHIFAGMGVKAYANIKEGRILDAVFDQGLWYVFYIGLILWLLGGMANLGSTFTQIGKVMTIVGAIGLILTQGRDKKNIFAKFFSGVLSLYDVTGFLSDVLSYSRLFALGLTTGVIGTVMNELGAMVGGKWYGWIFAAAILIVGHVFNIAINLLGAFVHTSRLQYIEFYGKFFEGGGKAFKPLRIRTRYNEIKN